MKPDLRKIAARQAAQAITVGILMDQVRLMREAGAFMGRAETQALKVERHCQNVMNTLPVIKSARGVRNIKVVCGNFPAARLKLAKA